jgi:hypothetical protein
VLALTIAVLAAMSAGTSQAATLASPGPVRQAAVTGGALLAYDAATRTVVMFADRQTWTWDGTAWTQRHPGRTPAARGGASMAYDPATRTVVLFGGKTTVSGPSLDATWTWNGTAWTEQHPATSPPARHGAGMAYDAATGDIVLFGGKNNGRAGLNGTWTWTGSNWVPQATETHPPAQVAPSMAYDAATGTVVLFGGVTVRTRDVLNGTWTWNGSKWTKRAPASSPPARFASAIASDAATGTVVLFGGEGGGTVGDRGTLGDTWTWNGATWTEQHPATSPAPRRDSAMADDTATGTVVLFGGYDPQGVPLGDTWAWNGTTWNQIPG